ncbi:MAG: S53 family peptidase [Nevskia sp.]|nr:S53 family peptidase [Nevskia sp.]
MAHKSLVGSERQALAGARLIGKADPAERLEVSLILNHRSADAFKQHVAKIRAGDRSAPRIKREEFAEKYGAENTALEAVRKFAAAHGLAVVQEAAARRTVVLSGTVAQFNKAFGVDLQQFEHPSGSYRGRTGAIQLPPELSGVVQAVLGLDNRPAASPHFRTRPPHGNVRWSRAAAAAGDTTFSPTQLASLYGFPDGAGAGECIAIIELGGGYRTADLTAYFNEIGIAPPQVTAVSVDHGKNHPTGDGNGPDGEVMLDIEVAGAVAPQAKIAVYFAPNTDAGFLDAVTTAIHDTTNKPSVISISWGGPESSWTQQSLNSFDQAFQDAATLGITVCVASGDNGSGDGATDGGDHVDFPASSPHALACGGTNLQAANGSISSESVWNDGANGGAGGGGVSAVFALPDWQKGLKVTTTKGESQALAMRGVPDVCGDADPQTGYNVRVDGTDTVVGGTSAVAPLWAGLIARLNAIKGSPVGFINTALYQNPASCNDITQGNNGDFAASAGWDACTGLGSPNGQQIAKIL